VRYKGTKYKDEILRALQGIDQAEEQERAKEGLERSVEYKDYVWKRKESHDVSDLLCYTSHLTYYNVTASLFFFETQGGSFSYQYAVLSRGIMSFYSNEKAYEENSKPLSRVKLRYMRYSTDRADYQVKEMSRAQVWSSIDKNRNPVYVAIPIYILGRI
jgi:hypothetical protein